MKLSILIPFRDADGSRTRTKEWIVARWRHFYPDAEIIEASDDGVDPFNKSMAVNNAAAKATGDVYAILDADAWIAQDWMDKALEAIESKRCNWTRPGRHMRLRQGFSEQMLAKPPEAPFPQLSTSRHSESYGAVVGFLWLVRASSWWDAAWHNEQGVARGMDERIRGWGGEDSAFSMAAKAIMGGPRHLGGTVVCLWHPRPRQTIGQHGQRVWVGQDRTTEQDKNELLMRYKRSVYRAAEMRKVLCQ